MEEVFTAILSAAIAAFVAVAISRREQSNLFRLAAIDRRLEAHQQAYRQWWNLMGKIHQMEAAHQAQECQRWWIDNCIYLDAESRREMWECSFLATNYRDLRDDRKPDETQERFNRLVRVFDLITKGVGLPPIGQEGAFKA